LKTEIQFITILHCLSIKACLLMYTFQSDKVNMSQLMTKSIDSYLQDMRCNGTYADHICLQNVSKMLSLDVLIIHADLPDVRLSPTAGLANGILTMGYIPESQHYVSLEPLNRYTLFS